MDDEYAFSALDKSIKNVQDERERARSLLFQKMRNAADVVVTGGSHGKWFLRLAL